MDIFVLKPNILSYKSGFYGKKRLPTCLAASKGTKQFGFNKVQIFGFGKVQDRLRFGIYSVQLQ